jgi:hypothetical protein
MLSFANVYFFGSGLFNELQPIQIKNSVRPSLPRELSWRRPIAPKPFLSGRRREILHTGKHNTMFGFRKDIVADSHSRKDCVRLQPEISALGSKLTCGKVEYFRAFFYFTVIWRNGRFSAQCARCRRHP